LKYIKFSYVAQFLHTYHYDCILIGDQPGRPQLHSRTVEQ